MDLDDEEWVHIPYDGLLEVHDDGGKKFFSRKYVRSPKNLFKMDYFDPPQKSQDDSRSSKQVIPLPIQTDDHPIVDHQEEDVKEVTKLPIVIKEEPKGSPPADLDPIFQVVFKKENEFVEMKMDSPRSSSRGISLPHTETDVFQYQDKSNDGIFNSSSPSKEEESNEGLNIWKWGWSGIGAFCSLGMAAATICIIILGNGHRIRQQNQKLRIQIYSDDKRIKQVVHHANEAMSAVRGVPLTRAQITYGGYHEGL